MLIDIITRLPLKKKGIHKPAKEEAKENGDTSTKKSYS
ncbi:unnamed protein product [Larinioides sclopetarius]|uniref:Uncharacterized protein n=1 Tax=Larinioides sclopetarius TaxID=280406 RepID=A0AAV2B856_9ARAC